MLAGTRGRRRVHTGRIFHGNALKRYGRRSRRRSRATGSNGEIVRSEHTARRQSGDKSDGPARMVIERWRKTNAETTSGMRSQQHRGRFAVGEQRRRRDAAQGANEKQKKIPRRTCGGDEVELPRESFFFHNK